MTAKEARELASKYTPDVSAIMEVIKQAAENGRYSISVNNMKIFNEDVRSFLKRKGYTIQWHEAQRDGWYEISW